MRLVGAGPPSRTFSSRIAVRLFVAADLPDDVRAAMPGTAVREKLHVTLVFIGDRVVAPVLDLVPPRAALRTTGPLRLGRVFAVGLEDPTGKWTAYQARLAAALEVDDPRPWRPHVTVARKRRPDPFEVPELEFVPPAVTLYRSAGGRYEALAQIET